MSRNCRRSFVISYRRCSSTPRRLHHVRVFSPSALTWAEIHSRRAGLTDAYVDPFVEDIQEREWVTMGGHERTSPSDRFRIALEKAEKGRLNAQARGHDQNGIDRLKDASEDEHLADGDIDGKTSEHGPDRGQGTVDRRECRLLLKTKQCRVDRRHLGRFDERKSNARGHHQEAGHVELTFSDP